MAQQLKNTLSFVNLVPGATVVLPHLLQTQGGKALAPDVVFIPSDSLSVTSDTINVTLFNAGAAALSGSVLVEAWHTYERAFGGVQNVDLSVKPYVIVSVEGGNQPPQPPFSVQTVTIFARTTGNDVTGNGTLATPYATFQRAVRDVPTEIPAGVRYDVDITGITEVLPLDYELPSWKVPETLIFDAANQFFLFAAGVNIRATPQLMAAIPPADAVIAAADILSTTQDTVTQLVTITLNVARASWAANALKGKFVVGADNNSGNNAVIYASTNNSITIANTGAPTTPISVMEPSAALSGTSTAANAGTRGCINALNCDSISFSGIKITTPTVNGFGLAIAGNSEGVVQLCELQNPAIASWSTEATRVVRTWIYGAAPRLAGNITLQQGMLDAVTALNFGGQGPLFLSLRRMAVDGCGPIDPIASPPGSGVLAFATAMFNIENTLVRNTPGATGDGVRFHGGRGRMSRVDVYGCGRDGVRANTGGGFLEMLNVRTAGGAANTGNGITITDGLMCQVDAVTSGAGAGTQLRGTGGEKKGGTGAGGTWANFVSGADGRPALNEYDITAAAATRATGTRTRPFQ